MAKKKDSFGDSPIGSGGRFAECVRQMRKRPSVYDPEGLCASIGRKKYGKRRFAKMGAKGKRNPPTTSRVAIEHVRRAMASLDEAFQHVRRADREAHGSDREQLKRLEDLTWGAYMASIGLYTGMAHQDRPRRNPLTDAEHMRTKKHTMELTDWQGFGPGQLESVSWRWKRAGMRQGKRAKRGLASHPILEYQGTFTVYGQFGETDVDVSGVVDDERMYDRKATDFSPDQVYEMVVEAIQYDLDESDWEPHWWYGDETYAEENPRRYDNPCGAGGYGPAANPVKPDGKWHRLDFLGLGKRGPVKGTQYSMATAKGEAEIIPYKPRTFDSSRLAAAHYEEIKGQKVPKGAKWLLFVYSAKAAREAAGAPWSARPKHPKPSAHKTLDGAKIAAENALRRLPMPNPAAQLTNEGILAGSTPIPSGLDRPRYQEGILAGSQPIPSGFGWPSTNAGVVDPPVARRTQPRQPK